MTRSSWLVAVALIAAAWAASAALYPSLPERVQTHWNYRGQVDAYGPKAWAAFLLPAAMAGMLALFAVLPWMSPEKFKVGSFRATYGFVAVLVLALLGYIHALALLAGLSPRSPIDRAMLAGLFLFFALLGNVLGRVRRNFWMGVRVPWTLASERVWSDTHRLAAWLFVAAGLLGFLLSVAGYLLAALVPLAVAIASPIVYSFVRYKSLERAGQLGEGA
jgi:uncharacterized membrane protein